MEILSRVQETVDIFLVWVLVCATSSDAHLEEGLQLFLADLTHFLVQFFHTGIQEVDQKITSMEKEIFLHGFESPNQVFLHDNDLDQFLVSPVVGSFNTFRKVSIRWLAKEIGRNTLNQPGIET